MLSTCELQRFQPALELLLLLVAPHILHMTVLYHSLSSLTITPVPVCLNSVWGLYVYYYHSRYDEALFSQLSNLF